MERVGKADCWVIGGRHVRYENTLILEGCVIEFDYDIPARWDSWQLAVFLTKKMYPELDFENAEITITDCLFQRVIRTIQENE